MARHLQEPELPRPVGNHHITSALAHHIEATIILHSAKDANSFEWVVDSSWTSVLKSAGLRSRMHALTLGYAGAALSAVAPHEVPR